MRKLRWVVGAVGLIIVLVVLLVVRNQRDDLDALRPYTIYYQVLYENKKQLIEDRGVAAADAPAGMQYRLFWIKGISQDNLLRILQRRTSSLRGWQIDVSGAKANGYCFEAVGGDADVAGLKALRGRRFLVVPDPGEPDFTVEERTPLTAVDITVLRLRNLGKDPFSEGLAFKTVITDLQLQSAQRSMHEV